MGIGVYTITNTITKKIYVGSTIRSFKKRWKEHKDALIEGTHYNTHLQHSWNKYGEDSFLFEVLEECDKEFCISSEVFWINQLNSISDGYNLGYPTISGYRLSTAVRKKMSDKAKLRDRSHLYTEEARSKISTATSNRNKTMIVRKGTGKYGKCEKYDLEFNLLQTYDNPYDAFRDMGFRNASHIIRASLTRGTLSGFRWKVYTKEGNLIE